MKHDLAAKRLRELLHYDPLTGIFTWRTNRKGLARIGNRAGSYSKGYIEIGVSTGRYYAHRLAWLYMTGEWPPMTMDHADLDRANNRWANLRLATFSQNGCNRRRRSDATSRFKGVVFHKQHKRWWARIRFEGKMKSLGTYATEVEAGRAYADAARRIHGEFARVD